MQASKDIAGGFCESSNVFMALGENIKAWREKKGWSTHRLASEADIYQSSISRYESNEVRPRRDKLEKIAAALGAELAQLEFGSADFEVVPIGKRRIPILDYVQAGTWTGVDKRRNGEEMADFVLTDAEYSADAFAMIVKGDSMMPEFKPGDIITIDPEVQPRIGDFVVAVDGKGEAVFKRYARVGFNADGREVFELRPLNDLHETWNSEVTPFKVIGTLVEKTRRYRNR